MAQGLEYAHYHVESVYASLTAFVKDPYMIAYSKAQDGFRDTLQKQDAYNAAIANFAISVITAGIAGCFGGLIEGAIGTQLTPYSAAIVLGSKEISKETVLEGLKAGSVDALKTAVQSCTVMGINNLFSGGLAALESVQEFKTDQHQNKMEARLLRDQTAVNDLLTTIGKYYGQKKFKQALDKYGLSDFDKHKDEWHKKSIQGPLHALAIKLTGNVDSKYFEDWSKNTSVEMLARRFELGWWYAWLIQRGPIWRNSGGGRGIPIRIWYEDQSFGDAGIRALDSAASYLLGSIPSQIQERILQLTGKTKDILNSRMIPHFDTTSGQFMSGSSPKLSDVVNLAKTQ